jgi:hypothetical protein
MLNHVVVVGSSTFSSFQQDGFATVIQVLVMLRMSVGIALSGGLLDSLLLVQVR